MAGTLVGNADDGGRSNEYLNHFSAGQNAANPPLQAHEKKILRVSDREHPNILERNHYIEQKTGLDPVSFFRRLEELSSHPGLSPARKKKYDEIMSRTGPQTGGAPIDVVGKQVKTYVAKQEPLQ